MPLTLLFSALVWGIEIIRRGIEWINRAVETILHALIMPALSAAITFASLLIVGLVHLIWTRTPDRPDSPHADAEHDRAFFGHADLMRRLDGDNNNDVVDAFHHELEHRVADRGARIARARLAAIDENDEVRVEEVLNDLPSPAKFR